MLPNTVRWLSTYLRGRSASVLYNNKESKKFILHQGVPQGAILSPSLFNLYVSSYPSATNLHTSYADDFTTFVSDHNVETASRELNRYSNEISSWAKEINLQISEQKSSVTLFTPQTQQSHHHPQITMNNQLLPLNRNPKILGVTFDPHFNFNMHVTNIVNKAKKRIPILKALAGSSWGQNKEALLITYKALIESVMNYAAPIWFPNVSESSIKKLQIVQNTALRIATGCIKMTPIQHLHTESKILHVKGHLNMLCTQFLATCLQPEHPSFASVTCDSGPRRMKETLQSAYTGRLYRYLSDGRIITDIDSVRADIHTRAVENEILNSEPNKVLNAPAPPICDEETTLPRSYRVRLSQMRSGYCSALGDYRERIGQSPTSLCPSCNLHTHTVNHVFNCAAHPTSLSPIDLWQRPKLAADFLAGLPFFRPAEEQRPPPEPPPLHVC